MAGCICGCERAICGGVASGVDGVLLYLTQTPAKTGSLPVSAALNLGRSKDALDIDGEASENS